MSRLLFRHGRLVDPATQTDEVMDVLVEDGRIALRAKHIEAEGTDLEIVDASGLLILPGLIDVHVHFRTPGQTHKETLSSGGRAAVAGGFTTVCTMPNTVPPVDNAILVEWMQYKAAAESPCKIRVIGAITVGQQGETLAPLAEMVEAGAVALSDDGRPVMRSDLMQRALEQGSRLNVPIVAHEEDLHLSGQGDMNAGPIASRLGLRGIPWTSEATMIARDVLLAERAGAHLHVAHVSTEASVSVIRWAQSRGVRVTAEVTPHHLFLDEEYFNEHPYDTGAKMSPPLRSPYDREALVDALLDGTIAMVATDHAPHHESDKDVPFDCAANGIVGLETSLSFVITELVNTGRLSWSDLVRRMSLAPAQHFGLNAGSLAPGMPADLCLVDPNARWRVNPDELHTLGRNLPWRGQELTGRCRMTVVDGRIVYRDGSGE